MFQRHLSEMRTPTLCKTLLQTAPLVRLMCKYKYCVWLNKVLRSNIYLNQLKEKRIVWIPLWRILVRCIDIHSQIFILTRQGIWYLYCVTTYVSESVGIISKVYRVYIWQVYNSRCSKHIVYNEQYILTIIWLSMFLVYF